MADGVLDTHADEDDSDDWGEWSAGAVQGAPTEDTSAEDVDWAGSDDGAEDGGAQAGDGDGHAEDGGGQAEDGGGRAEDGGGQAEDGDGRAEDGDGQAEDGDGQAKDGDDQAEDGGGQANDGDSRANDGASGAGNNVKKGGWLGDAIPEIAEDDDDWGGWSASGLKDAEASEPAATGPEEDPLNKAADARAAGSGDAPSKEGLPQDGPPKKPRMPLSTKAIPTPPRGPPPAHLLAARSNRGMAQYVIDNKDLREGKPGMPPTTGLLFRLSKNMDDKGLGCGAPWGTVVTGIDEGDGWLRFSYKGQDCYLPMAVNGKPVLRLQTASEKEAPKGSSPAPPRFGATAPAGSPPAGNPPAGNTRHINPLTPMMMQQLLNTARMRQQAQAVPRPYSQAPHQLPMAWAQHMAMASGAMYRGGIPFFAPATATNNGWLLPNAGAAQASQPSGAAQGAASVSENLKKLMAAEEQLKKFVAKHRLSPATEKELRELAPGLMLSVIGDTAGMDILQNGAKPGGDNGAADLAVRARITRLKAELGASACQAAAPQAGGNGAPPANQGVVVPPRVGPGTAPPRGGAAAAEAPATAPGARRDERQDKKPTEPSNKDQAAIKARIEKRGHTLDVAKMILEFVRSHGLPNEVEQALMMIPTRHVLLIIKNSSLFGASASKNEKVAAVLTEVRTADEQVYELIKKVLRDARPHDHATRKARSRSRSRKDKKHAVAAKGRRSPPRRHRSRSADARGKRRQPAPPPRRRSKSYGRHRRHERRRRSRSSYSKARSLDIRRIQALRHSKGKTADEVQPPAAPQGDSAPSDHNVKSCQEAAEGEPHRSMEVPAAQVDDSLDAGKSTGTARKSVLPDSAGMPEPDGDSEKAVWEWLLQRDGGKGAFLQYFPVLRDEFDCDFSQICAARLATPISPGTLGFIEPSFFEVLNVKSVGHRLLLAKGILALP